RGVRRAARPHLEHEEHARPLHGRRQRARGDRLRLHDRDRDLPADDRLRDARPRVRSRGRRQRRPPQQERRRRQQLARLRRLQRGHRLLAPGPPAPAPSRPRGRGAQLNPRVVTGLGVASALGIGREAFLAGLAAGTVPAAGAAIESFDGAPYPNARIAEVRGFDATKFLGDKGLRSLDRLAKLLVVTARLALHDTGLKKDGVWAASGAGAGARSWAERVGVVVSNAYGSLEAITELDRVAVLEDARYINPSRFPLTVSNSAAGYVSIWEDLRACN